MLVADCCMLVLCAGLVLALLILASGFWRLVFGVWPQKGSSGNRTSGFLPSRAPSR